MNKIKEQYDLFKWTLTCSTRFIWDSSYHYYMFRRDKRLKAAFYTLFPSLMPKTWQTKNNNPVTYFYNDKEGLFLGTNSVKLSIKYILNNLQPRNKK